MNLPPAKDIKPGTRFSVNTPNGIVEFRVLRFAHGEGVNRYATTIDGITMKQVVRLAQCSVGFGDAKFSGTFSLVKPMDDGTWAVRAEFLIQDAEFWGEGAA